MVSYLERSVDYTESLVTFICSDAEHLPASDSIATLVVICHIKTRILLELKPVLFEKKIVALH